MSLAGHSSEDISSLLDVADGLAIGHVFLSHLDVPTIIFQVSGDDFTYEDITVTEKILTEVCEEPVVYDGVLDLEVARKKAMEMIGDNALLGAMN